MAIEVMTEAAVGVLASTDALATIVFNAQTWTAAAVKLRVDTKSVMLNSDVNTSLLASQVTPPLVLTTTSPGGPYVGACIYDTGSSSTVDSVTLSKDGTFVATKVTFTFDCIVTVQPLLPATPFTADGDYPIDTVIPCDFTFTTEQAKLRA